MNSNSPKSLQTLLSVIVIGLGVLLLTYCVIVEDEPGGVSLLLVVSGTIWFLVTRYRLRSRNQTE